MVLLLPPAPAALVDAGRAFATRSFWSAAARLRMAVLGPPGGVGLDGRPLAAPTPGLTGDDAPGEDLNWFVRIGFQFESRNGRLCLWACRLRGGVWESCYVPLKRIGIWSDSEKEWIERIGAKRSSGVRTKSWCVG